MLRILQPLLGLAKLSSENPPVLMLAPFLGWEVLCEALKEASCTVRNNIKTSSTHCITSFFCVVFFFFILEFSLLERGLTRNTSFLSLQMRMVVNSLVEENILLFLPAWSFPQFESFSWFNCWPYSCSNISFFKVGDEDKAIHTFLSLVSILTWWSHFYQI